MGFWAGVRIGVRGRLIRDRDWRLVTFYGPDEGVPALMR